MSGPNTSAHQADPVVRIAETRRLDALNAADIR
jgi:hypothetical protein